MTVSHARNSKCAIEVFKCQNGLARNLFKDCFNKIQHQKETLGNNTNLLLPNVRTKADHDSYHFKDFRLFNTLPAELKRERPLFIFKKFIKNSIDKLDNTFN